MAVRGVCMITEHAGWQESGRCDVYFSFKGFQHVDEDVGGQVGVTATTSSLSLKSDIKALIAEWYGNHESENYDDWSALADNFILLGGVL